MTTRIIFVDDDPMLLASTRRQLHRKLDDCEMLFFERATDALDSIAETPADVVLSDLRMPEMNGAEFLNHVATAHPNTIRLAWTGQSEIEQLERVFGIAHQVFSKPCPTETLIEIINTVVTISQQPPEERLPLLPTALSELDVVCFLENSKAGSLDK